MDQIKSLTTIPYKKDEGIAEVWTRKSVREAVANIHIWLLRHYREEGLGEKWHATRQAIEANFGQLRPDHRARFRLEEALQALFRFDPAEAKRLLINWQSNDTLPFWEAKRAALMAELGEAARAHTILESSLSSIRQQLSLNPVTEDYTLVSQESVVMVLLQAVKDGMSLPDRDSDYRNLFDEMSERWNELARYKCDPRREMTSLSARLQHRSEGRRWVSRTHGFDLGSVFNTFRFGIDGEAVAAYGLLRMYEDIGMPYRVENTTFAQAPIESVLLRVRPYSPHWALAKLVRLGDVKAADGLFDREYLAGLRQDEVDGFFEIYVPAFERTIDMVSQPDWSAARTFELLAKTLPEVFSRLCYKCSPAYRARLVCALRGIYESKRRHVFTGVRSFAGRLFDSMSVEERAHAVPSLVDFPVPDRRGEIEKREFVNPLLLVDRAKVLRDLTLFVSVETIDALLDRATHASQDRDWVMTSLVWMHERGKLNEQQSERLGGALWDGIEAPGLPTVDGYPNYVCMTLPNPDEVDPEPLVKERLLSTIAEELGDRRLDNSLDELGSSAGVIKWSRRDALHLLDVVSEWWNEHKHRLHHRTPMPFGSPAEVTTHSIGKAVRALSSMFSHLPADERSAVRAEELEGFLQDLAAHKIPATELEAATMTMLTEAPEQVPDRVAEAMRDSNREVVVDALLAARIVAREYADQETPCEFAAVTAMLVQGVQWRHRPALADRLNVVADLVRNQSWFLSTTALAGLLGGLEQLAEETSLGVKGNDQDGVITIRAAAGALAFAVFGYYQASGAGIPEAIRRWREICSDPDEFSEVKNSWIIAGD